MPTSPQILTLWEEFAVFGKEMPEILLLVNEAFIIKFCFKDTFCTTHNTLEQQPTIHMCIYLQKFDVKLALEGK